MKIVYIARKFLEGFAYQDNELAEMHATMGHNVTVISSISDNSSLYFDMSLIKVSENNFNKKSSCGYNIIRLPLKHKVNFRLWEFKNLFQTLETLQPDLIFFHGAPMLCLLDLSKYKKKYPDITLVMDCHTDYNNSGHGFISRYIMHKMLYRGIIAYASKQIDYYYYLAPNIKIFMQDMYRIPNEKLRFLPRGGMLEHMNLDNTESIRREIRKQLGISQDDIVVVSGGKLDFKKMTHRLVEAVNRLNYPNVHLIVFGTVDKEYIELLEQSISKNEKIHLIGWVDSRKVYDYFLASDIAVFPGGHSVLWEQAICCGLPLIIKNWYDGMHYLNVKDNVLMLPENDTEYIENMLKRLIENPELRLSMQHNAQNEGREYFSYRRIAGMILSHVNSKGEETIE